MSWEEVKLEMVEEKGLPSAVADCIGHYVQLSGRVELLDKLTSDPKLMSVKDAAVGLEQMKLLLNYCQLLGVLERVREGGREGEEGRGDGEGGMGREGGRYMWREVGKREGGREGGREEGGREVGKREGGREGGKREGGREEGGR